MNVDSRFVDNMDSRFLDIVVYIISNIKGSGGYIHVCLSAAVAFSG